MRKFNTLIIRRKDFKITLMNCMAIDLIFCMIFFTKKLALKIVY